jgi:hypothetical protein
MMNWDGIGAVGEILGALVVMVTLLYLAKQVSDTKKAMRAQTRNEISRGLAEVLSFTSTSEVLADAWASARRGEALTPAQDVMLETFCESIFRYWENSHYQYRQGLYDEEEFSKHIDTIVSLVGRDAALMDWWSNNQSNYSTAFSEHLNQRLKSQSHE